MLALDSKVDATRWYAAVQAWMAGFWHVEPDAPEQPKTDESTPPPSQAADRRPGEPERRTNLARVWSSKGDSDEPEGPTLSE